MFSEDGENFSTLFHTEVAAEASVTAYQTLQFKLSTKARLDFYNDFMSPEPAKSVPGPALLNGNETCHFHATGGSSYSVIQFCSSETDDTSTTMLR